MAIPADELIREILALPSSDRALLAETLIDSLHGENPDLVRTWLKEVATRLAAIEPGGDVMNNPTRNINSSENGKAPH